MKKCILVCVAVLTTLSMVGGPSVPVASAEPFQAAEVGSWPMAGANPQRTSWSPEQVPTAEYLAAHRNEGNNGKLYPAWFIPIEARIPNKVQIVGANNMIYLSTARGLYAFNADTGAQQWVYATEMPLGHSPTYYEGAFGRRLYVGGLDHKIHSINADTGAGIWTYEAKADGIGAGFETNPLVLMVNGGITIFAGNRDGYMYAIRDNGNSPSLSWTYKTGGPVLYSAAASRNNSTIYFASNDSYAYALNPSNGSLVWKSAKLPGAGFFAWWPVVYTNPATSKDYVFLSGSHNYRDNVPPGPDGHYLNLDHLDREVFQGQDNYGYTGGTCGATIGQRRADGWIDTSARDPRAPMSVLDYYRNKPWRRTVFVLDAASGADADLNNDQQPDYAPFLWLGSQSGNRFPSIVAADGTVYQTAGLFYRNYIDGAGILGWKPGTSLANTPETYLQVVDEPVYAAAGGNIIYWSTHSDLAAGGFDTSVRNSEFWDNAYDASCQATNQPDIDATREWTYWDYNLDSIMPGYDAASGGWYFGGRNGSYGRNGDGNPPIPYRGKVFVVKGNSILAFGTQQTQVRGLPLAQVVQVSNWVPAVSEASLRSRLQDEVQKMVSAGHLRPGYFSSGHVDGPAVQTCGDNMLDYFHNPSDTLWALSAALPYLPESLAAQVKTYMQSEFSSYNPARISHVGWATGAAREWVDLPPEVDAQRANYSASEWPSYDFEGWGQKYGGTNIPPYAYYALWRYAVALNLSQADSRSLFDGNKGRLDTSPPADTVLARFPFVHNAYLTGYYGYLRLQERAGYPADSGIQSSYQSLLASRVSNFTNDASQYGGEYCSAFNASTNFLFLAPEIADYLGSAIRARVQAAVDEYNRDLAYWFVAGFDDTIGEAVHQPMYDTQLLQAKAYILKEPREELLKYLDVPGFKVGDLFYIQNLVALIEAQAGGPAPTFADVPFSHPYHDVIEVLYQAGYTAGCNTNPLMYCPEATMNRAESSVFVERGIHTATYDPPAPTSQVFADMPLDSWAAKWVTGLWSDQYTAGCGTNPLVYCPWQGHTRAEGCVFYLRMMRGAAYDPPQPTQQTFVDVPLEAWYAKWVKAAYDAGLIAACQTTPDLRLCPEGPLSRGLAAYMMVQAKGLTSSP